MAKIDKDCPPECEGIPDVYRRYNETWEQVDWEAVERMLKILDDGA